MAGHSKWSKVKRTKGSLDVERGAMFSSLVKVTGVAARPGGMTMILENAACGRFIFSHNHDSLTAGG